MISKREDIKIQFLRKLKSNYEPKSNGYENYLLVLMSDVLQDMKLSTGQVGDIANNTSNDFFLKLYSLNKFFIPKSIAYLILRDISND